MSTLRRVRRVAGAPVAEAAAFVLAAVAAAALASWLPDARALDAFVCLRYYLAQGCMP